MWTELSNTILAWATEINGKRHLSISIWHAEQLAREYKTGFFPSKPSESVHAGQTGIGLLEVSQEIYLSSPQQYRSDQKPLAIPIHLMDVNKNRAGAGPVPRICTATGSLIGVAVLGVRVRMENRWGSSKSAAWSLCYHASCLHLLEKRQ